MAARQMPRKILFSPQKFVDDANIDIAARFEDARKKLQQAGFMESRISTKLIIDVPSRAAAIVDEARKKNYGTIVMGRRGLPQVQSFFMGTGYQRGHLSGPGALGLGCQMR